MFEGVFVVRGRRERGDMIGERWKLGLEEGVAVGVAGVAGWGGLLAFSLPLSGVAVLEIGGD